MVSKNDPENDSGIPTCERLETISSCGNEGCEGLSDVAVDGKPECPECLSQREDHTGSWQVTAQRSRQRMRIAPWWNA